MTSKERLLNLVTLLIPVSLVYFVWSSLDPVYLINPQFTSGGWDLLIHKGFNTTFWWIQPAARLLPNTSTCALLIIALTCMASISSMRGEDSADRLSLVMSGFVPAFLLLLLFGPDQVTFTFTAQTGLTLLSCFLIRSGIAEHLRRGILFAGLAAILHVLWGTQISPYLLLALGAVVFTATTDNRHNQYQMGLYLLLALLTGALALAMLNEGHRPAVPDFGFPASARVVPDDGVAGNILPLLGETTVIPFINRPALKHAFKFPALLLLLVSLATLSRRNFPRRTLSWTAVAVCACLVFDAVPADSISTLAPLETLRRIMPGAFPLTLLPAFCALAISLLWIITARSRVRLAVLLACIIASRVGPGSLNALPDPFTRTLVENSAGFSTATSPSLDLLRHESMTSLELLRNRSSLALKSVAELDGSISTSHHKKLKTRKLLSDGRMDTRWSPRRGAQYGDEWIQIDLPVAATIAGIQAFPGKYFSDFPRAMIIENCQSGSDHVVRDIENWQGGLALTTTGYPYYTGQHDVSVQFSQPVTTTCIRLKQTAENPNFDWSIAELRLLIP